LAESKVVRPVCCGVLETEDAVDVAIDAGGFDLLRGIEIVTEPHRLIVSGSERLLNERGKTKSKKELPSQIFGIVKLPTKVDATKIESDLRGRILQIRISKAIEPEPTYSGQVES
jgi:HSP20 family molecular chaperone IbpA